MCNPRDLWENKYAPLLHCYMLHVTCYNKVVPHVAKPSFIGRPPPLNFFSKFGARFAFFS